MCYTLIWKTSTPSILPDTPMPNVCSLLPVQLSTSNHRKKHEKMIFSCLLYFFVKCFYLTRLCKVFLLDRLTQFDFSKLKCYKINMLHVVVWVMGKAVLYVLRILEQVYLIHLSLLYIIPILSLWLIITLTLYYFIIITRYRFIPLLLYYTNALLLYYFIITYFIF